MPVIPGVTPEANFYVESDPDTGRVRVRAPDNQLVMLIDARTPNGILLLAAAMTGLRLLTPDFKVYDLSLRRYIDKMPEPEDADPIKPADPA